MVVCGDSMELNRDYESAAIYKWRKKRKKAFVLFICIVGICFLVTRMVRVEDKTTVKVHNMHTEQNEKAIRYVASNMIKEDPKIAITFDDGPSPAWTPQLLDGLKERNVKATFFLIGENAKNNPELVKREAEEGHLIGNHTYHHVEITRVPDETAQEEILMTNEVITGITGEGAEIKSSESRCGSRGADTAR